MSGTAEPYSSKKGVLYTMPSADPVTVAKTPKVALITAVNIGKANSAKFWWQTLVLSWNAGIFIGLGSALACALAGSFNAMELTGSYPVFNGEEVITQQLALKISIPKAVVKMAAGATFPIGLFFVVLTGADLFTGNVMFVTTSLWAGHTTWQNAVKNLFVSYFGNIAGTLSLAYFMFHLTKLFQTPSIQAFVYGLADELVNQGSFGMNLLKGIGGNYLIGLALYAACVADDVMGKLVPLWWLAFAFIVIGFEHSIATAFFVPIAIMDGAPITAKAYIAKCLIPVTIGNMIGGCLFATVQTMMYSPVPGAAGNASSAPAWMLTQWPFLPAVTQVPGDLDKGLYSPAVSGTPSTPLDLEHPDESV